MKKLLLIPFLFCCFSFHSNAQVTFGIKGGVGISPLGYTKVMPDDKSPNKSFMTVPSIYGVVSIPVFESFSVRTGIGLNQQAYSYTTSNSFYVFNSNEDFVTYTDAVKCRLNYLEIPVSVSYKLPFFKRKLDISAGSSFGFNLGGRTEINRQVTPNRPEYTNNVSGSFGADAHAGDIPFDYDKTNTIFYSNGIYSNRYNWSVLFSTNYSLTKRLSLGVEAKIGLSNIAPHEHRGGFFGTYSKEDSRKSNIQTNSYMFTVTYMLGKVDKMN